MLFASIRAAYDDSFRIAGPLTPQCVTSKGPCARNFVPGIVVTTESTTVPIRLQKARSFMLKVKSEGTGASISCPRQARYCNPRPLGEPPVVMIVRWKMRCVSFSKSSFSLPSSVRCIPVSRC